MPHLALLRHGQSLWNLEKRFTGWIDVDLTSDGEAQARDGGRMLRESGVAFDALYTSVLTRAIRTASLALEQMDAAWLPVIKHWRLNERHYGALTGRKHADVEAQFGVEQVKIWRRSFDVPPPPLVGEDAAQFQNDRRYADVPSLPRGESLKTTLDRVLPYWDVVIAPELHRGRNLIIAAHGNSLRAIVKLLFGLSDSAIVGVEIPTGNPLLIDLESDLRPCAARYLDHARAEALPGAA
jgi:2,3-bisphosphoglycerate-dependent phosphoglycerate mutase